LTAAGISELAVTHRHGTFLETLEELEPLAELVVVGRHGQPTTAPQGSLGHHLEELVRMSIRPVLVAVHPFRPVQRFLIAFDNSPSARKAVAYVAASPFLRGLEGHLVMVGRADASHETALHEAREHLMRAGHTITADLKPGNPAAVVAAQVAALKIDLLVMGAYGHSAIREFIVGSTTTKLVRSCPVAVLMFR
jgi:nucleotide-binding universal stress UspA family protein